MCYINWTTLIFIYLTTLLGNTVSPFTANRFNQEKVIQLGCSQNSDCVLTLKWDVDLFNFKIKTGDRNQTLRYKLVSVRVGESHAIWLVNELPTNSHNPLWQVMHSFSIYLTKLGRLRRSGIHWPLDSLLFFFYLPGGRGDRGRSRPWEERERNSRRDLRREGGKWKSFFSIVNRTITRNGNPGLKYGPWREVHLPVTPSPVCCPTYKVICIPFFFNLAFQ